MGNRACIVFFDHERVSPTVYLHWHGDYVPQWLAELKTLMSTRLLDAPYATARFVGICHSRIPGNLSLGIEANTFTLAHIQRPAFLEMASPGNAGMVVVDTRDFTWRAFRGYLANQNGGNL